MGSVDFCAPMALELPPAAPSHPASHGSSRGVVCVPVHGPRPLPAPPAAMSVWVGVGCAVWEEWAWYLFGVLGVDQLALACHGDVEVAVMEMAATWAAVVVMAI